VNEDNNFTTNIIGKGATKLTRLSFFEESGQGAEDTDKLRQKKME
jgi:hypothetical protein